MHFDFLPESVSNNIREGCVEKYWIAWIGYHVCWWLNLFKAYINNINNSTERSLQAFKVTWWEINMDLREDITKPEPDGQPSFCLHKSLGPHICSCCCCCFTLFLWRSVSINFLMLNFLDRTSRSLIISMFVTVGIQQYVRTRMCVCVCVCMYLSLCVCVCVCTYTHTHTYIYKQGQIQVLWDQKLI